MARAGDRLGRYRLEHVLGQGGMGEVWAAEDEELARRVAVKVVKRGVGTDASEFTQRVMREARSAARLNHPNAVAVYDVGTHDDAPFVVMELVQGKTLRARLADGDVPLDQRVRWLVDAARALGAAHKQGIVHRDVKPDNIMIADDGTVKVLDFGIARAVANAAVDGSAPTAALDLATLTQEGAIVGTPLYMAPEQLRREPLDGRADQYAWGMTAYETLSGAPPWPTGDPVQTIAAALSERPAMVSTRAPSVGPAVDAAVQRTLEKSPSDRFASMEELVRAIEGGVVTPTVTQPSAVAPTPGKDGRRARSIASIVVVGGLGLIGTLTAVYVVAKERGKAPPVAGAASASSGRALPRAAATPEPDLQHRCGWPEPHAEAPDPRCDGGQIAWCDLREALSICCADGLVPSPDSAACICPPGGSTAKFAALECPKADGNPVSGPAIQAVVRPHFDEFRACYQASLKKRPTAEGRITVKFTIDPYGRPTRTRVGGASVPDPEMQACVVRDFAALRFAAPPDGDGVSVGYPIAFSPGGDDSDGGAP